MVQDKPAPPPHARSSQTGVSSEAAKKEILRELGSYYADFSARDWQKYADHFWPGATLTTIWKPEGEARDRVVVTTVPEFVAQAPKGPGSKPIFEERMTGAEVRVQGPLAHVWARYKARFGDPGKIADWSGVDAFTLMRLDGRWKIVALAYAGDE